VLAACVKSRRHAGNFAGLARDVGARISDLDNFADRRLKTLPMPILQKLAVEFYGKNVIIDEATMLLKKAPSQFHPAPVAFGAVGLDGAGGHQR
jgi:hypothetical protein